MAQLNDEQQFQYKNYLVCNINDSKPTPQILNKIKEFKKNKKLKMILMQSYAPASINNSFIDWSLRFDLLVSSLLILITFIGLLLTLYSINLTNLLIFIFFS